MRQVDRCADPSWCGGSFPSATPPVGSALPGRNSRCLSNNVQDACHRIQPVGCTVTLGLEPVRAAAQPVCQDDGRAGLLAAEAVVLVVVGRDVDGTSGWGCTAIPELVGHDRFGGELFAAAYHCERARRAARTRTSTSSLVGVRTARETAPHTTFRGLGIQRARTVGWNSNPLNSLCSPRAPTVRCDLLREP